MGMTGSDENRIQWLYIGFPNDEQFRVDAEVIARDRGQYYAEKDHPDDEEAQEEVFESEVKYALSDRLDLLDWVGSNMNWEDLEPHAEKVGEAEYPSHSEMFRDADFEVDSRTDGQ